MDLYNEVVKFYSSKAERAKQLGEAFMELPKLSIDFSDIDVATKQIADLVPYYTNGTHRPNAYSDVFESERVMLKSAREKILSSALADMPTAQHVLVVTTDYKPHDFNRDKFYERIDEMAANPSDIVCIIYSVFCPEWIAFCPERKTFEQIDEIIKDWCGAPETAKIEYR